MATRYANLDDVRRAARRRLPRVITDFIEGGAEDETTVSANIAAFRRWSFVPRVLVDVSTRDLSATVLGTTLSLPVVLAPTGLARLAHPDGEVAAARAAASAGTVFVLSTGASRTIEQVRAASDGSLWFQLYTWRDRSVVGDLVRRAATAGYGALVVTVDVPLIGRRERDLRNGMTLPPRLTARNAVDLLLHPRRLRGLWQARDITFANFVGVPGRGASVADLGGYVNAAMMNPSTDWDTFEWLRRQWTGPLAVKGVLHPGDATRAVELGADAVIVSNHGGRQLDGAVASLDALPAIAAAVGGRADVLLDGGIRRGTDVLKAMALGASAVLIGRPYVYGLGASGADGVAAVLALLRDEIDRACALLGLRRAAAIDRAAVTSTAGVDRGA